MQEDLSGTNNTRASQKKITIRIPHELYFRGCHQLVDEQVSWQELLESFIEEYTSGALHRRGREIYRTRQRR
jgi:hypothetical protein